MTSSRRIRHGCDHRVHFSRRTPIKFFVSEIRESIFETSPYALVHLADPLNFRPQSRLTRRWWSFVSFVDRQPGFGSGAHREAIAAFVLRMTGMSFDPLDPNTMVLAKREQSVPQLPIGNRPSFTTPCLRAPRAGPTLQDAVGHVLGVG